MKASQFSDAQKAYALKIYNQEQSAMSVAETCRVLGLGRTRVYELLATGHLQAQSSGPLYSDS
jgi:excisionase family DNA binding protein